MRGFSALIVACFAWTGTALACEVEEWNYSYRTPHLIVFGVATCSTGEIGIRVYNDEGENRELVGVSQTYIRSYIFEAPILLSERPNAISVKFMTGR